MAVLVQEKTPRIVERVSRAIFCGPLRGLSGFHHFSETSPERFHLGFSADSDTHEIWQGRENSSNFDPTRAQGANYGSHFASQIDHHEVRVRRYVPKPKAIKLVIEIFPDVAVQFAELSDVR